MSTEKKTVAAVALALASAALMVQAPCFAASKEECVEAHTRGQDLRERGLISRARQVFMTCAQSSCPGVVQADCARLGDELAAIVPSVTFGARDASATDLPNTTVYVDDVLVTTRLDDGKSYEVEPGKHTVRYVHDGKETSLKVILNQGEKGRVLLATFLDGATAPRHIEVEPPDRPAEAKRPGFPLVVAGLGGAALAAGAVTFALGVAQVPSNCSVSTHDCTAPPNDPSIDKARSGMALANIGVTTGISGAVVLIGGLVWYFAQPAQWSDSRRARLFSPAFTF